MTNQKALARKSIATNTETQENQFEGRGFAVQNKSDIQTQKTDLNTQLKRAITYGHSISKLAGQENSSASPQTNGLSIQAKLSIGEPGDRYEQEADRVASQVVQRINTPSSTGESVQREAMPEEEEELQMKPLTDSIQRVEVDDEEELQMKSLVDSIQRVEVDDEAELQMKSQVQRQEAIGGGEASTDLESDINSARGGGQALADNIREPMEQAFGADFSGVKVHTDGQSDQLNQSIQARAFTTGQDVFFRQGEYNPVSRGGQELLAHELTHVVQQSGQRNAMQSQSFYPSQIQRNGDDSDKEPSEGSLRPSLGKALWRNLYGSNWYAKGIFKAMNFAMYMEGQPLTKEHDAVLQDSLIKNEKGVLDTLIAENPFVMKSTGSTPIYLLGKYAVHKPLEYYLKNKKE